MKKYLTLFALIGTIVVAGCCSHGEKILFPFDSYDLSSQDKTELDAVVTRLKNTPSEKVKLIGHTDSTGSKSYNMQLSERRAEEAAEYLMDKGISSNRIMVKARGPKDPIETNETMKGRMMNRRVEIMFYQ